MAKLTPEQFQDKHARRLRASTADITAGIERVTVNPCELAAAKQAKMLANLQESVTGGKWAAGLRRVPIDEWKRKAKEIGVPRIGSGIDAAKGKVVAFAAQLLPFIDTQVEKIKSMPDTTIDDNVRRMETFIRGMATFKRT